MKTKKSATPPPPPPPAAKHYAFDDPRPTDVHPHVPVAKRPTAPMGATHVEFKCCNGSTIVQAISGQGDFSTLRGTLTFGRMRYNTEFIRMGDPAFDQPDAERSTENAPKGPPPPPKPKVVKTPRAPGLPKGEGVCAFIDGLVMEGGRKASEIAALVVAKFPGRELAATLSTVKVRPSHCKKKGLVPPPFVKE